MAINKKPIDLIIFMGQSNMAGRGVVNARHPEDAPDDYRVRHKVMVWTQRESDADNHVTPEEYKQNLRKIVNEMESVGVEHCYLVRIGKYNGGNKSLSYEPIQQAQVEFCNENKDCTMASLILDTFKEKGMMKDAFHYYQNAYNIVGEDAGLNTGQQLYALHSLK